ncbi:hypothetical protein [Stackebrandtia soli]|uniref:hypothetical protein n=1 Tax=Stackebrandtia soli TaxID=1892856 RepID=UPI0039EA4349
MTSPSPVPPPTASVPSPPPSPEPVSAPVGPGAVVPFAAPPRDRDGNKLVLWIVLGVLSGLLVCGGGGVGLVSILVWANGEILERTEDTAAKFLDDIVADRYDDAYDELCADRRQAISLDQFTTDWESLQVTDYELLPAGTSQEGDPVAPAEFTTEDGSTGKVTLVIRVDPENGAMQVCGW